MYKNFLRIVISGRALNVIFRSLQNVILRHLLNIILGFIPRIHTRHLSNVILDHTSNVILGFIPRIHGKHYSLDTRVKPEYDADLMVDTRDRLSVKPKYDNQWNFTKGLDVVCRCAALLERLKTHIKIHPIFCHPRAWLSARPEDLDSRNKSENDNLVAQCGRSMIEMLGVLAIIGVLSVGGIAGYSKAMEKFKINKTIQHITEIAANVQTLYMPQKDFNGLSSASSMFIPDDLDKGVSTQGFTIMEQWRTPEFFSIRYFGLSKEACFSLATADWGADSSSGVYAIVVGDVSAIDYIPEDNPTEGSDFDKNYGNSQDSSYYATKKYLPISPAKITSYCTDEGAGNYNANSFGILFKK